MLSWVLMRAIKVVLRVLLAVVGAFVVFLGVVMCVEWYEAGRTEASANASNSSGEQSAPPEVLEVTADQLQAEYATNEVRADAKYRGRLLYVTGAVQAIKKGFNDRPYVALWTQNEFETVSAYFDSEGPLLALRPGIRIAVQCVGAGKAIEPLLAHCQIDQAYHPGAGNACTVPNADETGHIVHGTCRAKSDCVGTYYTGYCPGDADVICCVSQ
jgi:hypothetical protein